MSERLNAIVQAIRSAFARSARGLTGAGRAVASGVFNARGLIVAAAGVAAVGYGLYKHPPLQTVERGEIGVRSNAMTGGINQFREGSVLVVPGVHALRRYSLRDQVYRPLQSAKAGGEAPFQSVEGLSIGVDLYTVREIFSTKRAEIQQAIEKELAPKLAADGIVLRSVQMGKIDLPADYRQGLDRLLAEELETEKMRYTLELKEKRVQETALDAEAQKVRREKAAEAAGNEQIIAARAQEEAMKHVLPFKQRQIEQRRLEAEAEKQSRIKGAEANAQARRIEAAGEAESRQKLADAEAYRLERVGKISSEQMERDGALLSKHPLLIQKTLADKLSDKVSVIIAPPPADGGFIGSTLLGSPAKTAHVNSAAKEGE
ncbi:MAG TPA: prohibitin family protein [Burkholderiaceae bacterium]|jgi:regulator of protease activity HflC (stomatin/prohibitin superfamily)|nr:prohibitin family protein [Burkholderiaceae bacterium]